MKVRLKQEWIKQRIDILRSSLKELHHFKGFDLRADLANMAFGVGEPCAQASVYVFIVR